MKRMLMVLMTTSLLAWAGTLALAANRNAGARELPPPATMQSADDDDGPMAGMPEPPDGFDPMGGPGGRGGRRGGPGGPGGPMGGPPPEFGGPGMGPERMFEQLTGALALTDQQRDKLADIRDGHEREMIRARADLEIARLDLRKLVDLDTPDRGAINAQIDRLAQMEAGLHKTHMAMMLDSRAVLTAAQAKKLRELRASHGPGERPMRPRRRIGTM